MTTPEPTPPPSVVSDGLAEDERELAAEIAADFWDRVHRAGAFAALSQMSQEVLTDFMESALAARDAEWAERVADAWDQGWLASKRHERSVGQPKMSYWPNPHRATLAQPAAADQEGER